MSNLAGTSPGAPELLPQGMTFDQLAREISERIPQGELAYGASKRIPQRYLASQGWPPEAPEVIELAIDAATGELREFFKRFQPAAAGKERPPWSPEAAVALHLAAALTISGRPREILKRAWEARTGAAVPSCWISEVWYPTTNGLPTTSGQLAAEDAKEFQCC